MDLGEGVVWTGDCNNLVVEKCLAHYGRVQIGRRGSDCHIHCAREQQGVELGGAVRAQLDVEVVSAACEQLYETGCRVLGEQAGRCDTEQPPTAVRLTDLADSAVLQTEHLSRPTGEAEATRGESQSRCCAGEQLVAEFLAELTDVHGRGCLGHAQLRGSLLDRAKSNNRGESTQLGGCHERLFLTHGGNWARSLWEYTSMCCLPKSFPPSRYSSRVARVSTVAPIQTSCGSLVLSCPPASRRGISAGQRKPLSNKVTHVELGTVSQRTV